LSEVLHEQQASLDVVLVRLPVDGRGDPHRSPLTRFRVAGPYPALSVIPALAAAVRAGPLEAHADEHTALAFHRAAVLVPVGMLPGERPVVLDEQVHRLRKGDDFGGSVDLDPVPEEAVVQDTKRDPRIAADVLDLERRLACADRDPSAGVDTTDDG